MTQDPDLIKAAGLPLRQWVNTIPVRGLCPDLELFSSTLVSLNILDNPFDKQDWQCITDKLTLLKVCVAGPWLTPTASLPEGTWECLCCSGKPQPSTCCACEQTAYRPMHQPT